MASAFRRSPLKKTSEERVLINEPVKNSSKAGSSSSRSLNLEFSGSAQLRPKQDHQIRHDRSASSSPNFSVRFRRKKIAKKHGDARPKSMGVIGTFDMAKTDSAAGNHMPLVEALNNKKIKAGFRLFLQSEFSCENLDFWLKAEEYRNLTKPEDRKIKAKELYEDYVSTGATNQINLDHDNRGDIMRQLGSEATPSRDLFVNAQKYIFNIMENDSYARFLHSRYYDLSQTSGRRTPRKFLRDLWHT